MAPVAVRRSARLQRRSQVPPENNTIAGKHGEDSMPQRRGSRKTETAQLRPAAMASPKKKHSRVSKAIKNPTTSVRPSVELDDTHSSTGQNTNAQNALAYDHTCSSDWNGYYGSVQTAPSGGSSQYYGTLDNEDTRRAAFDAFLARDAESRRLMYGYEADLEDDESMVDYFSDDDETSVNSPQNMLDNELADNMPVDPTGPITYEPSWMSPISFDQHAEASPTSFPYDETTSGSLSRGRATGTLRTSPINRCSDLWTQYYNPARHDGSMRDHTQAASTKDYFPQRHAHCASNACWARDDEAKYHQMSRMRDYNRQTPIPMQPLPSQAQSQHGTSTLERQGTKGKQFEARMPRSEELNEPHHIDANLQQSPPQYVGSGFVPHAYM
ncbi:hypothetical protein F503_04364 [Ophiostoma piceae UAMH 11346]|uniref:Uncharacterized protein n=1 Tax=Ophiostoma piceae (strain UAMH 11346) TaxID=1262450 RepID=S3C7I6_OPHP1|nr:hypothetical protein F503_04364 [Ophiostoma piceae UAMH 11346]